MCNEFQWHLVFVCLSRPLASEENTVLVECLVPNKVTLTPKPVDPDTKMGSNMASGKVGMKAKNK